MEKREQLIPPQQAVILCGGLGTRLRPLTNNLPKPMVLVNGKPFLHHLIKQIVDQGIKRVLLLTGYLGEMITSYFGSGKAIGIEIIYSCGPQDWDTGRRLWEARELIESQFLLLYSDNFVQFNLPRLQQFHNKQGTPISLLLAPKDNGNIEVANDGRVVSYDKSRIGKNLDYVEVGYMIIERNFLLSEFPGVNGFPDFDFADLLAKLSEKQKISGLVVNAPYHSISDVNRLDLTSKYLLPKKILLIDRDGTINTKAPPGDYITNWADLELIQDTLKAMITLAKMSFEFIIITNQAGISRKLITSEELKNIHENLIQLLASEGVTILDIYVSPDHWNDNSYTRKPAPGLFFQAAKDHNLRLDHCLYIGDDERDCMAAANAGCGMIYLSDNDPELPNFPEPYFRVKSLLDSTKLIKDMYQKWKDSL